MTLKMPSRQVFAPKVSTPGCGPGVAVTPVEMTLSAFLALAPASRSEPSGKCSARDLGSQDPRQFLGKWHLLEGPEKGTESQNVLPKG